MVTNEESGRGPEGVPAFSASAAQQLAGATLAVQKRLLATVPRDQMEPWLELLEADERTGSRRLASTLRRKLAGERLLESRWAELAEFDRRSAGGLLLAGVDEVGRGPLAGPVTAAAVILPPDYHAPGLDDSKRLTPQAREDWAARLREEALSWGLADLPAEEIDRIGIRRAVFLVMGRALRALSPQPERILIDGRELPSGARKSVAVIGGDGKSLSIAAASVLAKAHRDALMRAEDIRWPGYGFAAHKGYGSAEHQAALLELGPCPLHRRSFCGRWLAGKVSGASAKRAGSAG